MKGSKFKVGSLKYDKDGLIPAKYVLAFLLTIALMLPIYSFNTPVCLVNGLSIRRLFANYFKKPAFT